MPLPIWTVYDHPKDHPDIYVVRLFIGEQITDEAYGHADLEVLRDMLRKRGLTCLARFPNDDPVILETWI